MLRGYRRGGPESITLLVDKNVNFVLKFPDDWD